MIPVITSVGIETELYDEKKAARSPSHAKGTPGRTGTTVPIKPTTRIMPAAIVIKIL